MGSKSVGLYLEVAAGFDAILGLDPVLSRRDHLRARRAAALDRRHQRERGADGAGRHARGRRRHRSRDPYVHGEVCGSVDFFFFEVEGCVSLTIGNPTTPTPDPRPLVAGVCAHLPRSRVHRGHRHGGSGRRQARRRHRRRGRRRRARPSRSMRSRRSPSGRRRRASGDIVMGKKPFGSSGAACEPVDADRRPVVAVRARQRRDERSVRPGGRQDAEHVVGAGGAGGRGGRTRARAARLAADPAVQGGALR